MYDCFFLKNDACDDKESYKDWPWNLPVDDERVFIIDKFHYFIRAVLEKNLPLQEYILKFMQFAEENKDTIVIADEIGNGIVPLDAFEREYREQTGRAEILLAKSRRGSSRNMWNRSENKINCIFIRHGCTVSNREHRYLGRTDESLDEAGVLSLKCTK